MDASEAIAAMKAIPGRMVAFSVTKEQNSEGEQTVVKTVQPSGSTPFTHMFSASRIYGL